MSTKTVAYIGLLIGSTIGGLIPGLFGASLISYPAVIGSVIGGLLGIWIAWRATT